jgi:HPt (histidine-containing phosphotransfer) domain-containing protein
MLSQRPVMHEPEGALDPQPPAAAEPAAGQLDEQALARLRELDPNGSNHLLQRVTDAFASSTARLLPQLEAAQANADLDGVKHVAHTLKSSSASIGALRLSGLCADIEGMIRQREVEGLALRVVQVRTEVMAVSASLRSLLQGAG